MREMPLPTSQIEAMVLLLGNSDKEHLDEDISEYRLDDTIHEVDNLKCSRDRLFVEADG